MKKRIMSILIASVMAASLLAGCGSSSSDKTAEKDTIESTEKTEDTSEDRDTLIVGFDAEYPPYGYMDDSGEYVGFDLDCAQLVCDALGWKLEKKPINWDSKDMELESGTIDCIWNGFSITPDRQDMYTWSEPYVDNTQVMVVKADSGMTKLADLSGKNVVVQAASAALEALNGEDCAELKASFASLSENPDYNTAFMNLDAGAADAIAVDIGVAQYQLQERGADQYVILEEPFFKEQYGIGFRLGDEALRDTVQEQMDKLAADGKLDELADQYGIDPQMICLGK